MWSRRTTTCQSELACYLLVDTADVSIRSATIYNVLLPQDTPTTGDSLTITITQVYNHLASPVPKALEQSSVDGQMLLWQADILGGAALLGPVNEAKIRIKCVLAHM